MIQVATVIECTANRGLISKISWPTRAKEVIWVKKLIHEALLWKALHRQWERFLFDTIRKKKRFLQYKPTHGRAGSSLLEAGL